jgi:hypothetical protein
VFVASLFGLLAEQARAMRGIRRPTARTSQRRKRLILVWVNAFRFSSPNRSLPAGGSETQKGLQRAGESTCSVEGRESDLEGAPSGQSKNPRGRKMACRPADGIGVSSYIVRNGKKVVKRVINSSALTAFPILLQSLLLARLIFIPTVVNSLRQDNSHQHPEERVLVGRRPNG